MGYTTDFEGTFKLNKKLDANTHELLTGLCTTRRMTRRGLAEEYGIEGEFYVGDELMHTVVDHNQPPSTQPGLWNHWAPTEDGTGIEWDGGEKFYYYVEWLDYVIEKVLAPRGYKLSGEVTWRGEDHNDIGVIHVANNTVTPYGGTLVIPKKTVTKKKAVKTDNNSTIMLRHHRIEDRCYFEATDLVKLLAWAEETGTSGVIVVAQELKRIAKL